MTGPQVIATIFFGLFCMALFFGIMYARWQGWSDRQGDE